jgi:hypothetical protein
VYRTDTGKNTGQPTELKAQYVSFVVHVLPGVNLGFDARVLLLGLRVDGDAPRARKGAHLRTANGIS